MQRADELLTEMGYAEWRPGQREAVVAALEGRDSLIVMPTGGGKSVCYQLPGLASEELTIVVSPLIALMADSAASAVDDYLQVKKLRVICGTEGPQEAELTMSVGGEERFVDATGDGPVDAVFNAVKMLYPHGAKLDLYQVQAVTEGTDAQATVSVRLSKDGRVFTGQSADTDTVVASARAYVNALNRLHAGQGRTSNSALMQSAG